MKKTRVKKSRDIVPLSCFWWDFSSKDYIQCIVCFAVAWTVVHAVTRGESLTM